MWRHPTQRHVFSTKPKAAKMWSCNLSLVCSEHQNGKKKAWFKQSDKDDDQHDYGREKQVNFILRKEDACVNVQQQFVRHIQSM